MTLYITQIVMMIHIKLNLYDTNDFVYNYMSDDNIYII